MRDAHTIRLTALYTALTMLGPEDITELPAITLQDVLDGEHPTALETARDQLITATCITLGQALADQTRSFRETAESVVPRSLAVHTMKATRWVQNLISALGGIIVSDLLADAVVAAATYQLALAADGRDHVTLLHVATTVLNQANSPA